MIEEAIKQWVRNEFQESPNVSKNGLRIAMKALTGLALKEYDSIKEQITSQGKCQT